MIVAVAKKTVDDVEGREYCVHTIPFDGITVYVDSAFGHLDTFALFLSSQLIFVLWLSSCGYLEPNEYHSLWFRFLEFLSCQAKTFTFVSPALTLLCLYSFFLSFRPPLPSSPILHRDCAIVRV